MPNFQRSKRRRSRKYSDEWEALRFWRFYCQETGERALQGALSSSRGVRARLPGSCTATGQGTVAPVSMEEAPVGFEEAAFHREQG